MDEYTDLMIPPRSQKEHRIFFGPLFIGIFRSTISVIWRENTSTAREISDLTPEQKAALFSEKNLWVIFDNWGNVAGFSKKNLTP